MNADREVIREGEDKKSGVGLFGRKKDPVSKDPCPPAVHSHPIPHTESMNSSTSIVDGGLPPRASNDSATKVDEGAIIPKYAGFDFQAIKETIGEEGLDVEKEPAPSPGPGSPGVAAPSTPTLAHPPQPPERFESALPLINCPPDPIRAPDSPGTLTPPTAQLPRDGTANLSSTFSGALPLNDLPEEEKPSASSPISSTAPTHPLRENFATTDRQTPTHSDISMTPFESADGDIWAPGAAPSTGAQLIFGRGDGTIFGGNSNPYGNYSSPISYGFSNGSVNRDESNATSAASNLTFEGADGSIHAAEDPWKPKKITAGKKKYTPNPWDS